MISEIVEDFSDQPITVGLLSDGLIEGVWSRRCQAQSRFRIASLSKLFTMVLVEKLVEDGLIDLGVDANAYTPWVTGNTVYQLLTHTTGIEDDSCLCHEGSMLRTYPVRYMNIDYYFLSDIVEKVTGKSFSRCLRDEIFDPLNMYDSGVLDESETYCGDERYIYNDVKCFTVYTDQQHIASSGMYSSMNDMLVFMSELLRGELVEDVSAVLKVQRTVNPGSVIDYIGDIGFFNSIIRIDEIHGICLVVLGGSISLDVFIKEKLWPAVMKRRLDETQV